MKPKDYIGKYVKIGYTVYIKVVHAIIENGNLFVSNKPDNDQWKTSAWKIDDHWKIEVITEEFFNLNTKKRLFQITKLMKPGVKGTALIERDSLEVVKKEESKLMYKEEDYTDKHYSEDYYYVESPLMRWKIYIPK